MPDAQVVDLEEFRRYVDQACADATLRAHVHLLISEVARLRQHTEDVVRTNNLELERRRAAEDRVRALEVEREHLVSQLTGGHACSPPKLTTGRGIV